MFALFRVRNQTVECYIDHYYGRPAIASPAPPLRHAGSTALVSAQLGRFCRAGSASQAPPPNSYLGPPATHIPNHARNQWFSRVFSPDAIEYNYA